MKIVIFSVFTLFLSAASAKNLKVEEFPGEFVVKKISAEQVKGVNIVLSLELETDCNGANISVVPTSVDGNKGIGWNETFFVNTAVFSTMMGCEDQTLQKEVIKSAPWFVSSFTNEHIDGAVDINIIVPSEVKVEVTEVK